jgi:hypothetical protein
MVKTASWLMGVGVCVALFAVPALAQTQPNSQPPSSNAPAAAGSSTSANPQPAQPTSSTSSNTSANPAPANAQQNSPPNAAPAPSQDQGNTMAPPRQAERRHPMRHHPVGTDRAAARSGEARGGGFKSCYDYAWQSEAMKNCLSHHEGEAEDSHHAMHHAARHHRLAHPAAAHHAARHRHAHRASASGDEPANTSGGTNTGATPMPNAGPTGGAGNQPGSQ